MYSISSTGASSTASQLQQLLALQKVGSTSTDGASAASTLLGGGSDTVQVSKPGELFSKLQQLQSADPEKLKAVLSDIASKLKEAAASQSGAGADRLNELASKFEEAAQTGDLSALKPPEPPQQSGASGVQAYQRNGRAGGPPPGPPPGGGSSDDKSTLDSLWSSLLDEVDDALSSSTS
jgi:hypothetical protein